MSLVDVVVYLVIALVCGVVACGVLPGRSVGRFIVSTAAALLGATVGGLLASSIGAPESWPFSIGGRIPVLWAILGASMVTIGVTWLQSAGSGGGSGPGQGPVSRQWARFEAEARLRWARLTDTDWRLAANTVTGLAGRIQQRYGDRQEAVLKQLNLLMFRVREKVLPLFGAEAAPWAGSLRGGWAPRDRTGNPRVGAALHAESPPLQVTPALDQPGLRPTDAAGEAAVRGRAFSLATAEVAPGVVQIQLRGVVGAASHHELAEVLARLIRGGTVRLVVDCSEVEAISSAGAAACVVAAGHAQERGGNLVFLRPSAPVRELFEVLGLDTIVPRADDLPAALAHLPRLPAAAVDLSLELSIP